ncbi:hypothetical protein [Streptomyces lavendulocolor]|uniref:hypothetical protein n=1 Tax=Streptomyces lavendulocolor TaxID=67316 RepID=UPI003C2E758A
MKAVQHPSTAVWTCRLSKPIASPFVSNHAAAPVPVTRSWAARPDSGSPDSDEAVLCPTEVDELEAFLAEYRNETF